MKKALLIISLIFTTTLLLGCDDSKPNLKTYTVTWYNDNGEILEIDKNVIDGSMPMYNGSTPIKEEVIDDFHCYSFNNWDKPLQPVHSDIAYMATYKEIIDPSISVFNILNSISLTLMIEPIKGKNLKIDWGDGNDPIEYGDEVNVYDYTYSKWGNYSILVKNATSIGNMISGFDVYKSIVLGNSITSIPAQGYNGLSSLESIELSNSIKTINYQAFSGCTNIRNINIPNSVTSMDKEVFNEWNSTQTITLPFKETKIPSTWDKEWNKGCKAKIIYNSLKY